MSSRCDYCSASVTKNGHSRLVCLRSCCPGSNGVILPHEACAIHFSVDSGTPLACAYCGDILAVKGDSPPNDATRIDHFKARFEAQQKEPPTDEEPTAETFWACFYALEAPKELWAVRQELARKKEDLAGLHTNMQAIFCRATDASTERISSLAAVAKREVAEICRLKRRAAEVERTLQQMKHHSRVDRDLVARIEQAEQAKCVS